MKIKPDTVLILGGLAVLGYVLYKAFDVGSTAIDKTSSAIADIWLKLNPLPPAMSLLGNVKFPGNLLVPLQKIATTRGDGVRQDSAGNVYVKYSGYTWKLAPQVNGNWPATRVS